MAGLVIPDEWVVKPSNGGFWDLALNFLRNVPMDPLHMAFVITVLVVIQLVFIVNMPCSGLELL